tara:strand:+ start:1334 stop:2176 length:843 start_codon:yes stop_codon:yes gene_type:complete
MRTSYYLALNHLNLTLGDDYIKSNEGNNQESIVGIGDTFGIYDLHNFSDRMHVDTPISRGKFSGFAFKSREERYWNAFDDFPPLSSRVGIGSTTIGTNGISSSFIGYETVQKSLENVTKAMLLAILDGTSKRTTTVGIGSIIDKKKIFFNTLYDERWRDNTAKPWGGANSFNSTHSTITGITSISRLNNVATVILNSNHGLNTNYDDWGAVLEVTGINTSSFNISTTTYPNGVPIVLTSNNSFTYRNIGLNTSHTSSITGTIDVKVGWGGTSNNLHLHFI